MHVLLWNRVENAFWTGTAESASLMGISYYEKRHQIQKFIELETEKGKELDKIMQWTFMGIAENQDEITKLMHKIQGIT